MSDNPLHTMTTFDHKQTIEPDCAHKEQLKVERQADDKR
jgi:hypothetical protein